MRTWNVSPFSRFEAMPRLMDEAELQALMREPGFDLNMIRTLRRERRRVFRLYLAELVSEFRTIEREATYRAANDPSVDPTFLEAVMKIRVSFTFSVVMLRLRLSLMPNSTAAVHRKTVALVGALQPLLAR